MARGRAVVISGPSGVGKTTIARELERDRRIRRSVSATTRPPREGEKDGVDYRFLTKKQFEEKIARGELLEHAEILGNYYGTLRRPVEEAVSAGLACILSIDVQGARILREKKFEATYIFLVPPDMETLRARLEKRGTESEAAIERRLKLAEQEMKEQRRYDRIVVNDSVERAVREILDIIFPEKTRAEGQGE